ncbi:MarR family transcriptional regulator [Dickeya chrysanthemi]|uniref:MarR family transcriptional regulator n=1 Tax=Dickeya chrysanthemi TaxID=556 RepID=UPI0025A007E0|nr:MarR family transcriptional regulator [Dickeya chrysanthemi]WJM83737.1 MarR family transcriptional regulator [Dickeya chrysanthemi]
MNRSNNETVCSIGLLIHLSNQFKEHLLNEYFADTDITAPQFKVLISIYKGITSPVEVSKNVMVDGGGLSRMVERMVKRELIVRQPHPDDKRQVVLALTEKGREICRYFEQDGMQVIPAQLTARLTPQETEQLIYLLTKMLPDEVVARYLPY